MGRNGRRLVFVVFEGWHGSCKREMRHQTTHSQTDDLFFSIENTTLTPVSGVEMTLGV